MPPDTQGTINLVAAKFAPALGRSLADAAAEPRGLRRDGFLPPPRTLASGCRPQCRAVESGRAGGGWAGLFRRPGDSAGERVAAGVAAALAGAPRPLQRLARKRRQVEAILPQSDGPLRTLEQLLAQIDQLTRDLDRRARAKSSTNWPINATAAADGPRRPRRFRR